MAEEKGPPASQTPVKGVLKVRATVIRDGTPGISLALGAKVVGEWTDFRARTLTLSDDMRVQVLGADSELLYLFSAPGKILSAEAVSDKEVVVNFEMI